MARDEWIFALGATMLIHSGAAWSLVRSANGSTRVEEREPETKPFIGAVLVKEGEVRPKEALPDRLVKAEAPKGDPGPKPTEKTAPRKDPAPSRNADMKRVETMDAGAAPTTPDPAPKDDDIDRLAKQTDALAESRAKKPSSEEGRPGGDPGGTVSDEELAKAGALYGAELNRYFHERWKIPTTLSPADLARLCVRIRINVGPRMNIWHVGEKPDVSSGNDLFDESARNMLESIRDGKSSLPEPPGVISEQFRGRTLRLKLSGDPRGDACK
ncbi:MAG: hypothetical protein KBF88_03720 [Polyangiaceae bacterium]|nr:hypothetical protein [Polyangiaceae bacterium]